MKASFRISTTICHQECWEFVAVILNKTPSIKTLTKLHLVIACFCVCDRVFAIHHIEFLFLSRSVVATRRKTKLARLFSLFRKREASSFLEAVDYYYIRGCSKAEQPAVYWAASASEAAKRNRCRRLRAEFCAFAHFLSPRQFARQLWLLKSLCRVLQVRSYQTWPKGLKFGQHGRLRGRFRLGLFAVAPGIFARVVGAKRGASTPGKCPEKVGRATGN